MLYILLKWDTDTWLIYSFLYFYCYICYIYIVKVGYYCYKVEYRDTLLEYFNVLTRGHRSGSVLWKWYTFLLNLDPKTVLLLWYVRLC